MPSRFMTYEQEIEAFEPVAEALAEAVKIWREQGRSWGEIAVLTGIEFIEIDAG